MKLLMFSKMLKEVGSLSVDEAGDRIVEMGFDGVDLTVRPGGHVLPEEVIVKLPEAVDILESKGLTVPMITTGVTDAKEKYVEDIFRTASQCGVKFLKLGYWRYGGFGKLKEQIESVRSRLKGIQDLSKRYGITAAIHSHSGDFLSANPAVVWILLRDYSPDYLGAYIDPGHMAVEGSLSGWRMGMDLLSQHIRMVAVKDFGWFQERDEKTGKKRWRLDLVPLGDGLVPWPQVFTHLREIKFDGPVSVHSEYGNLGLEELIQQTKKDLNYLKNIIGAL